jgi:serine protease AprX
MTSPLRVTACLLALAVLLSADAFADSRRARPIQSAHVDEALRDTSKLPSRPRVIVKYREGRREQVRKRLTAQNGRNFRQHDGIGALSLELPAKALSAMAADPDVLGLSIDAQVAVQSKKSTSQTPARAKGKGHNKAPTTTDGYTLPAWFDSQALRSTLGVEIGESGADVGIALIDSGISPSPDLEGRIAAFYDFTKGGIAATPSDEYGHGTHIAGLIAGSGKLSEYNYVGIALGARLIGLKVLDSEGQGYTSDVLAAIDFAVANREMLRIDVINLSLGHPIFEPAASDPLVQAVERAAAAGIIVVVSAGNNGYNPDTGEVTPA